jgi:hypothetical protein
MTFNKYPSRKAQLTLFIILGLVIVSIFGFVFFATGEVQRIRAERQAEKIVNELLETTALQFYINLCTEQAVKEGIDILSKQGGRLAPNQPGALLQSPEVSYLQQTPKRAYHVSYGIKRDILPLPQYPCRNFPNSELAPAFCAYVAGDVRFESVKFGVVNLPALCKSRAEGCTAVEGSDTRISVQAQLESFISEYVKECVDFSSISELNQTYDVQEGNVSSEITFSDRDVVAIVNFPIIVTPPAQQPVIRLITFHTTLPSRFKTLYSIARELVRRDVEEFRGAPYFSVKTNFTDVLKSRFGTQDVGIGIEVQKNVRGFDSFVRLTDLAAEPENELSLQFLIANRPPVLSYIYPPEPRLAPCGVYDLVVRENSDLVLTPNAFDTEEDALSYSYSGWLVSYNETISTANLQYDARGCPITVPIKKSIETPRWQFGANGIATVHLTEADVGPHEFTVTVCDPSQLCDYQVVRVLVHDVLKVSVNNTNLFGTSEFSIEDPYLVNADVTTIYNPGLYQYAWRIQDNFGIEIKSLDPWTKELRVPNDMEQGEVNIENIKSKLDAFFNSGNIYKFISIVRQLPGQEARNETSVIVNECISFSSASSAYPYNTTDPFLSNHSCCSSLTKTVKLAGEGPCYAPKTYGSYLSFDLAKYNKKYDQDHAGEFTKTTNALPPATNDIFVREFKRFCDGKRGNICGGNIVETFSAISCPDKNANEIATCLGPPEIYLKPNSEQALSTAPLCISYNKNTFENLTGQSNSIRCNSVPKCTEFNNKDDGFVNTGANKHFYCNATCGPNGCSQTLSSLCTDCYSLQTCSGPTSASFDPQKSPNENGAVVYKQFTSCSDSTGCTLPQDEIEQSCIDNDNLQAYVCRSDVTNTAGPYLALAPINCGTRYEIAAVKSGTACTEYEQSKCDNDKCKTPKQNTRLDVPTGKFDSASQTYFYRRYDPKHVWGSSAVLESCIFTDIDFDTLTESICQSGSFKNGKSGIWHADKVGTQQACCGDDLGAGEDPGVTC